MVLPQGNGAPKTRYPHRGEATEITGVVMYDMIWRHMVLLCVGSVITGLIVSGYGLSGPFGHILHILLCSFGRKKIIVKNILLGKRLDFH